MKIPQKLLVKLSPLVEAARGAPLIEPFVEIGTFTDECLSIRSSHGEFVFDRIRCVVMQDDAEISSFGVVQTVDIGAFPGGRGEKSWSITLYCGFIDRITIGRTYDDGEASVVASKIARVLGCKVVSLTHG